MRSCQITTIYICGRLGSRSFPLLALCVQQKMRLRLLKVRRGKRERKRNCYDSGSSNAKEARPNDSRDGHPVLHGKRWRKQNLLSRSRHARRARAAPPAWVPNYESHVQRFNAATRKPISPGGAGPAWLWAIRHAASREFRIFLRQPCSNHRSVQ